MKTNDLKSVYIDRDKYKIELPLLEKDEIDTIDNYFNEISDDFMQKYIHDKDLAVAQRLIKNLREENKQLREVIDKAIEYINEYAWQEDIIGDMYTTTGKSIVDKYMQLEWDNCKELLDILKEVE